MPTKMTQIEDRQHGALWGLAVGDALGAPVEFQEPGKFPVVTGYQRGGVHNLYPGQWTDDTSMALALADSMAEKGWDLHDQMRKYVLWWKDGDYSVNGWCFDIGSTTRDSLSTFNTDGDPRACADASEGASGNGSIMRLAPVPIRYHRLLDADLAELCRLAEESSLTTHASHQCLSACRYMAAVMAALIRGEARESVLSPDWPVLLWMEKNRPLHPQVLDVARGSYRSKAKAIRASGWVVECLEAALWAFHDAPDFQNAVLKAVNLGYDADTVGAVCGQFAGAYWGYTGIPVELTGYLDRPNMIQKAVNGLLAA